MALVYDVLSEAALGDNAQSHHGVLEHGVFRRSSNGDLYVVTWIDPNPATTVLPSQRNYGSVGIFKSPAGGASWTELQRPNPFTIHPFASPDGATYYSEFGHLRCQQVGDILHIAACSRLRSNGNPEPAEYRYAQFDMSSDTLSTWETIFEATNEIFDPFQEVTYAGQTIHGIEMHARDNGDVLFLHYGDAYVSGGSFSAIWANPLLARVRTSAGSWGSHFDMGPTSGTSAGTIDGFVRSGNRTHLFMSQGSGSESDSALRTVSSGLVAHPGTWEDSILPGTDKRLVEATASGHARIEGGENIAIAIYKAHNEEPVTLLRFLDTDLAHDTFLESTVDIDDVGLGVYAAPNNYHLTEWIGGTPDQEMFFGVTEYDFTNNELRLKIVQEAGAGTYTFLGYSLFLEAEPDLAEADESILSASNIANVLSYRVFNDGTNPFLSVLYIVSTLDADGRRYGQIKYIEVDVTIPMASTMAGATGLAATAAVANTARSNLSADGLDHVIDRGSPNGHFRLDEASGNDAENRGQGGDGLYLARFLMGQPPIADRDPEGSTSVRFGVDS